jgi:hypothetical protein
MKNYSHSRRLALALWLLLCLATPSWAVLNAADVWEVRGAVLNGSPGPGNDNNGGAFKAGATGTDRSQQNVAQVAIDNAAITTSITANVITFTGGYSPSTADVGNVVHMLTGTNVTAGFYEITSQVTGTSWTVTGAAALPTSGTTTNATGNMGGALGGSAVNSGLTILSGANAMVASNKAYCTGAFSGTTVTFAQNITTPTGAAPPTRLIGYGTTRGDAIKAKFSLTGGSGQSAFILTGVAFDAENLTVDCGSLATSTGITCAQNHVSIQSCKILNFTTMGLNLTGSFDNEVVDTEVTLGAGTAAVTVSNGVVRCCYIHDNTCVGLVMQANAIVRSNIIANNTGGSSDAIQVAYAATVVSNTIHGNGRDGIRLTSNIFIITDIRNNLITNNGGIGLDQAATVFPAAVVYDGNAYYNNTSGPRSNMDSIAGIYGVNSYVNTRDVIPTASPYVGPTTGSTANFALNNTAGGGAAVQGKGSPGAFPGLATTVGALDMGAVQTRGGITRNPPMAPRPPTPKPKHRVIKKALLRLHRRQEVAR